MNSHSELETETVLCAGLQTRWLAWQTRHQALLVALALVLSAASLVWPAAPAWFAWSQPALLAGLLLGFGAVEPALVVVVAAWSGAFWAARVRALVGGILEEHWIVLGVLLGGVVATLHVQARLSVFRGRSARSSELGASVATLTAALFGVVLFTRGASASAAALLPSLSALLLAPIGMNILFLRGRVSGSPRLIHLLGGLLVLAFMCLFQVQLFLLFDPWLRLRGVGREERLARLRARSHRGMGYLFLKFPYGRTEILGLTPETFRRPSIVVSNHQSSVDIPVILSLPGDVRLTLKKRVWDQPYLGIGARKLGHILVEPERPEATLERCRAAMAEGACVHFFPEGTRGDDVYPRRFHRGAFDVAIQLGCDVIPVVLCDSRLCVPRDGYWVERFRMVIKVLPPITPASFDFAAGPRELMRHTQALVRAELLKELARINTPEVLGYKVRRHYRYLGRGVERRVARELAGAELRALEALALPTEGSLLDLFSGLGVRANWLREKHPRLRVHGLDPDADAVRVARLSAAGTERLSFASGAPQDWHIPAASAVVLGPSRAALERAALSALLARLAQALPTGAPLAWLQAPADASALCAAAGFLPAGAVYVRGPSS